MSAYGRSRGLVVATLLPVLVTTACSAMVTRPPPDRPLAEEHECTRGRAPEIIDAVTGGITGGGALLILAVTALEYESSKDDTQASWDVHRIEPDKGGLVTGVVGAAAATALLASAKYGHDATRACDAARAELRARTLLRWAPTAWPPLQPPPPAPGPWYPPGSSPARE